MYLTVAVSKLAQVSRVVADLTRDEMTASGGQVTSASRCPDVLLDVICADILLSFHESPHSLFLPRISKSFSTSAIVQISEGGVASTLRHCKLLIKV